MILGINSLFIHAGKILKIGDSIKYYFRGEMKYPNDYLTVINIQKINKCNLSHKCKGMNCIITLQTSDGYRIEAKEACFRLNWDNIIVYNSTELAMS